MARDVSCAYSNLSLTRDLGAMVLTLKLEVAIPSPEVCVEGG